MKRFFPPRPGITLFHPFLPQYLPRDWMAQRKFKGQRNLLYASKDGGVEFWSRHAENGFEHGNYDLTDAMKIAVASLNLPREDVVLDGELLHAKTKNLRDTLVLFDVLYVGRYLRSTPQEERLEMLSEFCRHPTTLEPKKRALLVNDRIWMAEVFQDDFVQHFKELSHLDEIEGLILRRRGNLLSHGNTSLGRRKHEVPWLVRVRKEEKNYMF